MDKNLRDLALLTNTLIGVGLVIWGVVGGVDDGASLARLGIGLGTTGLANIARAVYALVDQREG